MNCHQQGRYDRTEPYMLADGERRWYNSITLFCVWWHQGIITVDLPCLAGGTSRLLQCCQRLSDTGHQLHNTDQASSPVGILLRQADPLHIQLSLHWEHNRSDVSFLIFTGVNNILHTEEILHSSWFTSKCNVLTLKNKNMLEF